ncbi:LemA family protein [Pseudomonas sp. GV071]|uniref:LemA family protein n=1 Tax=Pseudomonas sp. GV071 TaxID=2135754 RepID=UPI000D36B752|nr:LemA family protein [Pseudomonas sp. GV071]PTQ67493.1 LemA protein [Pseudomonas sp. GV071]
MQGLWVWGVIAVLVLLAVAVIYGYNRLVFNRARVAAAWSDIDVQLKRRSSLIPQLVDCLKTYMAYESSTLTALTEQRSQAQRAERSDANERGAAESLVSATLLQVFARAEAYPELKADSVFLDLQHNLSEVEETIQMARRYYNGAVRELNVLVESVPSNLIANAFGFTGAVYFSLDDASQAQPPKMEF